MVYIITSKSKSKRFYPHYNSAMGKYVHTKDDYLKEMKKCNYIPYDEASKIADENKRRSQKPFDKPSKKAENIIREVGMMTPDKDGKIKFGGRMIEALKDIGVVKPIPKHLPKELKDAGGFE